MKGKEKKSSFARLLKMLRLHSFEDIRNKEYLYRDDIGDRHNNTSGEAFRLFLQ